MLEWDKSVPTAAPISPQLTQEPAKLPNISQLTRTRRDTILPHGPHMSPDGVGHIEDTEAAGPRSSEIWLPRKVKLRDTHLGRMDEGIVC